MEQSEKHPLVAKADEQYTNGSLAHALELYKAALADEPENPLIHNRIGAILAQTGDLAQAESALNRALALDSSLAQAHSNLGNLFYARGDYNAALAKYLEAAAINPENPVFQENLHAAYKKLGKVSEAVAALKKSHKLNRDAGRQQTREQMGNMRTGLKGRFGCLTLPVVLALAVVLVTVLF